MTAIGATDMMLDAVQLSFISSVGEDELTHADRIAAGYGGKRLLAKILYQSLVDEALAHQRGNGPARELKTFWHGDWCAAICSYLDLEHEQVLEFVRGVRDGTEDLETDKRRKV